MNNKILFITAFAALLAAQTSFASDDSFNANSFITQQEANMNTESNTYDAVANQALSDLQAFLKKNPIANDDDNKKNEALPPPQANHFTLPVMPQQQAAPQQAMPKQQNNNGTQPQNDNPSNLPINSGEGSSGWQYQV